MTSDTQQDTQKKDAESTAASVDVIEPLNLGTCTVNNPVTGEPTRYYAVFAGPAEEATLNNRVKAITGVVDAGDDAESLAYARMFAQAPELLATGAMLATALRTICQQVGLDLRNSTLSMPDTEEHTITLADVLAQFDYAFRNAHGMPHPVPAEKSAEEPAAGEMHDDTIIH